jgi:hypothetical protein
MTETNDPPIIDPRLLESGGPLALSIDGLGGDAADEQDPKPHASEHDAGAVDTIDAQALANFAHGATHAAGSTDAIAVENLDTAGPSGQFLAVGPSGNLVFETAGGISESDALAQTLVFS